MCENDATVLILILIILCDIQVNTERAIRHAIQDRLPIVVVINKVASSCICFFVQSVHHREHDVQFFSIKVLLFIKKKVINKVALLLPLSLSAYLLCISHFIIEQ